ncbi:MAG: hypothetical protein ACOX6T_21790 [Myxococcales bacterium]|jgi:hypothetical protein
MTSRIGEILVRAKLIDELQLRSALADQQQWGGRLAKIVVEKRFAKESAVIDALSKALGVPRVELDKVEKDAGALLKVDPNYAKEKAIFPCALKDNGKTLWVAMADPSDIPTLDDLVMKTGARVRPVIAGETEIMTAIERHYFGRDPSVMPQAFGSIAPLDADGDEGKLVDMAGNTIITSIKDIRPHAPAKAPPPAPAPPMAGAAVASLLDDLLGGGAAPTLTPQEMERVRVIQDQQEKGARILRAALELCLEKGCFRIDEYRAKLQR